MSSDAPGPRWFYVQGGRRQGPVELPRLVEILLALEAPNEALVWQPGMPEWVRAGSLDAIRRELPPPVPRPHESADVPEPVASEDDPAGGPSAPGAAADGAAPNIVLPAPENGSGEDSGRLRRRRHRHHHKKGVISRDFRPYLLPLLVLLLTMVVALWWLLRRMNEVPPGRILIQGALACPDAASPAGGRAPA